MCWNFDARSGNIVTNKWCEQVCVCLCGEWRCCIYSHNVTYRIVKNHRQSCADYIYVQWNETLRVWQPSFSPQRRSDDTTRVCCSSFFFSYTFCDSNINSMLYMQPPERLLYNQRRICYICITNTFSNNGKVHRMRKDVELRIMSMLTYGNGTR